MYEEEDLDIYEEEGLDESPSFPLTPNRALKFSMLLIVSLVRGRYETVI